MKYLPALVFLLLTNSIKSQEYTMFWNSKSVSNPAASGLENNVYAAVTGRALWVGLEGNPKFGTAIFDYKFNNSKSGIGINYFTEKMAYTKIKMGNANYSYHINLEDKVLSIGISAGFGQEKIDFSKLQSEFELDPILSENYKRNFINYKFGMYYLSNHFEVGLSATNSRINGSDYFEKRVYVLYWLTSLYKIDISENLKLIPNIMINASKLNEKLSLSSGLLISLKERFWTGISFKSYANSNAFGAMLGYDISGMIRIGYSYDFYNHPILKKYGNHEIIAAFILK